MTVLNGGQRDESHPQRKVGRAINAFPSGAERKQAEITFLEEKHQVYSDLGFDITPRPSGKGRSITARKRS